MRYLFADACLDTQRYELQRAGVSIPLRPKVYQVLAYLLAQRDRVVRKEELLAHVWPGVYVGEATLNSYIMAVRQALGDDGQSQRLVRTVRGRGYRFVARVEVQDEAPPVDQPPIERPLAADAPAPTPPPPPVAPAAVAAPFWLPASHSDGEYKPVSVLCCGLLETTALTMARGPEGLYGVMQMVVGLAHEVVQRYAGLIIHYAPEGFTAVFGAPMAQEDHARRAVLAALDLQQCLCQPPGLGTPALSAGLAMSMGVHSGLVVVGGLGPASQRLVTAVGAPTQVATRLQQQAAPSTILLSAATYHLVHEEVRGEPCGTLTINGRHAPQPVYTVQGLVQRHAGVPRRSSRSWSPFVGRQRELALLHDRLETVRTGEGQVVSLVGPPGMGKSRLLTEFRRRLPPDQVAWCTGQCLAYGQTTPYLPVRDIVQQVCTLAEGDGMEAPAAAVRRRLERLGRVGEEDVALVLQLLDLPVAPELLARLSPETQQARTFALLWYLIRHEAQQGPLILAVEDVHWIDPTSEAWLASLVERLGGAAVLLLVTQRPEYQPPWGTHAAVTQLALPPLRAEDSQAVVEAVPGSVQLSAARRRQIVTHGAGNPFFIEELAWHAVEHGLSATPVPVPETVHAVLAARIDRLPAVEKSLLQTAAVIGHEVPVPLLLALAELSKDALQRGLAHLQAAELLYETRLFPERVFTFKHALTHEVAYGSLLQERQRALHARIVEILEALAGDRLAEQVERLAHHALQGVVWDKALVYCRQAGEKAMARSAYREVVAYFEQALVALEHLPDSRGTDEQAIDLRLGLDSALNALGGELGQRLDYLRTAEALAQALDDPLQLGRVATSLIHALWQAGDSQRAVEAGQRARALAAACGDISLQVGTHFHLGQVYYSLGDYRQARDVLGQNVTTLQDTLLYERFGRDGLPAVLSRAWLGFCLAELGAFTEGLAVAKEGLRIAETVDHPFSVAEACRGVSLLYLRRGEVHQAIPVLKRAMGLCQDAYIPLFSPWVTAALGMAYVLAGRCAAGLPLVERGVEQAVASGRRGWLVLVISWLSQAYLLAGRLADALPLAERALVLARTHQEQGHQAYVLHLLGEIAAQHDPPDVGQAETHYHQALALTDELAMRPLEAHCHRGLGTLYAKISRREQAHTEVSTAIDLYRALGMTFWLPQAEAVLAQSFVRSEAIASPEAPRAAG